MPKGKKKDLAVVILEDSLAKLLGKKKKKKKKVGEQPMKDKLGVKENM